jgi:hypothetical protein
MLHGKLVVEHCSNHPGFPLRQAYILETQASFRTPEIVLPAPLEGTFIQAG